MSRLAVVLRSVGALEVPEFQNLRCPVDLRTHPTNSDRRRGGGAGEEMTDWSCGGYRVTAAG